ncbi:MAG: ROK family glucokinase [Nocardioidaceae bacterium]|nr:ROK family glucokinase [Nocardioidaceae bacterium]
MGLTVGVDIGGTKIAAGVVDDSGTILAVERETTPATDPDAIADAVAATVHRLRADHVIEAVGIGAAGFIDAERATVLFAPNISWVGEPLAEHVKTRVQLPVVVENDANAAAWGEFRFGAGRDVQDLLLITVGTGIGGGIVTGGRLYRGAQGLAAEVGHMRMVAAGVRCGCGQYGCWEQYASGRALVREAHDRLDSELPEALALAAVVGTDRDRVTGPMITEQARAGDPMCIALLVDVGRWLGEGIASLTAVLDPAVVVIGGGVAAAGDLLLEPARHALVRTLPAATHRKNPDLRLAALGNAAGMIGAADLARQP